ncbi:PKD domain-containing protein [Algoriphagus zhangzhouensis]|uniref:Gliding motility-associated C-terminal domain-containing protein n=1 Tax=Algoriphagus zhangzhouensis TaxID=1073327 RepID=A0A1M7ZHZ2_9BACT|nr:PKD domain-containing protein [Algoriphagus zhangzhouensis]SHO64493.1 gliding motility-associated C-terminal domain-containing protein [Algoriphagus zhangzhouensis]
MKNALLIIFFFAFSLTTSLVKAQVSIPRAGFPYCEPFTGTASDLRPETILGGTPNLASVGGGSLVLTEAQPYQAGYMYIDIPFSIEYGVKVSFEYSSYGATVSGGGADGFSFFMFDAQYGEVSNGSPFQFQTGGFGGSLGYAPIQQNPSAVNPSPPYFPGLTGGFIGIGFDEWGNFVRDSEARGSGLPDNASNAPYYTYPHTISIRGPENPGGAYAPYPFLGNSLASDYVVDVVDEHSFEIDINGNNAVWNCNDSDYRKVLIDLEPVFDGAGNPTGAYKISLQMNVGGTVYTIFDQLDYSFPNVPENIKIGFAASTGQNTNFHEIRNLEVDVSTINEVGKPVVSPADRRTCVGEELTILIDDVELKQGATFIQCVQLYDPALLNSPSPPWENITNNDPNIDCGPAGICNQCSDGNLEYEVPGKGTFYITPLGDLEYDASGNLISGINDIEVTFVPVPGATGEASVIYTVQDNYSLISEPALITVTINPIPEITATEVSNPTCDGQDDGQIRVELDQLLDGATFRWLWDGNPITTEAPIPGIVDGKAELILTNVNLGSYRLEVFNPLNDGEGGSCPNLLDEIVVSQQNGTPVELEPFDTDICEGTPATITPFLDPEFNPDNLPVPFKWYTSADRSGGALPTSGSSTIDGVNIDVQIASDGTLSVEGLIADGLNPKTYTFYVETSFVNNNGSGSGNFCPFVGDVMSEAVITVYPALSISVNETPDWCRDSNGQIEIEALGGNGDKTFVLFDSENNELETKIDPANATFSGLLPGDYFVEIESANPTCLESIPVEIKGAEEELTIAEIARTPTSCDLDNGTFELEVAGGNGTLSVSNLSISGGVDNGVSYNSSTNTYTYSGLEPGVNYTVTVTDEQNCTASLNFTLDEIQTPVFDVQTPSNLCEDQASLEFQVTYDFFEVAATAVPEFNWYETETGGSPLGNGNGLGGMTLQIDNATGELILTDLVDGAYTLWLEMSGPDACNLPRLAVDFEVLPLPDAGEPLVTNVSCNGGTDGEIQAVLQSGNLSDYLYQLERNSTVIVPFADNGGEFLNVEAGDYTIRIQNKVSGCEIVSPEVTVIEPPLLEISNGVTVDPTCLQDNGVINFSVWGGTPDSNSNYEITINGQALSSYDFAVTVGSDGTNEIQVSSLAGGVYDISINDSRSCSVSTSMTIEAQTLPVYEVEDQEICVNEVVTFDPVIVDAGSPDANPVFRWYKDASGIDEVVSGVDSDWGMTFQVDSNTGQLNVTDLQQDGEYTLYLKPDILNACDFTAIPVLLKVNPIPAVDFESDPVSCFGGSDGVIRVTSGSDPSYTYTLNTGESNTTGEFSGLAAGDYEVTISDAIGCSSVSQITVVEPPVLEFSNGVTVDPTCLQDNGVINFSVWGGTPDSNSNYEITINGQALSSYDFAVTVGSDGTNEIQVSSLAGGVYDISINDSRSCSVSTSMTIEAQTLPVYEVEDQEICVNEVATFDPVIVDAGSPDANPVFRWYKDASGIDEVVSGVDSDWGMTFQVDSNTGQLNVTDLQQDGEYTLYLKPDILNACDFTAIPVLLKVKPIPAVDFESDSVSCFGGSDGVIRVTSGSDPSYTYTLNTGESNTTGEFSGLTAGDYEVTISDAIGCSSVSQITVVEPDELQILGVEKLDPTCGDDNGEIKFEISGGTSDYLITINGSSIESYSYQIAGLVYTVQDLSPGTYSVGVVDANGCEVPESELYTLVNNEGIDIQPDQMEDLICESGVAVLDPNITIPAGASPELRWFFDASASQEIFSNSSPASDGNIYQINGTGILSIENLAGGTYTYYLRIAGPGICTKIFEANVLVNEAIAASLEIDPITCFGESDGVITVVDISGGNGEFEYSLDGTNWQASNQFSGLSVGDYQVQIRDSSSSNGCTFTISGNVEGPEGAISSNNPDLIRTSCDLDNGAVRNLEITGGWGDYDFQWRKDNPIDGTLLSQGTISGIEDLATGTYYLIVRDSGGCEEVFVFEIEDASDPVYDVIPPVESCFGEINEIRPVHLAPDPSLPPVAPTEVRWYTGPGQSGLISNGQDSTDPSIIYTIDDSDWLNPALEIENLPVGVHDFYFYVVCTGQEIKIDIEVFDTPEVEVEITPVTCFGDNNGGIHVISGDDPSYTYSLDGGASMSLSELENISFEVGSHELQVWTPAGCPQVIPFEIQGPTAPLELENLEGIDPGCGALNGKIFADIKGGWAPYTVEVFKNGVSFDVLDGVGADLEVDGLSLGDYYLVISDSEGCSITSPTLTLVDGPTQILVDDQIICEGESVIFSPVLDPQVSSPTFIWSFDPQGNNLIQSSTSPASDGIIYEISSNGELKVTGLGASSQPYVYYVIAEGQGVCLGYRAEPEVKVVETPTAVVAVTNEVCFGDGGIIEVQASGGDGTYEYSIDGTNFQSSNIFNVETGVYDVVVTSGAGCAFTVSNVEVLGPSEAISISELEGKNSSCNLDNGSISFTISGGYEVYSVKIYKNGNSVGTQQVGSDGIFMIDELGIGEYSFEITDLGGCIYTFESPMEVVEEPTQILTEDDYICEGEIAVLEPEVNSNSPNVTFSWFFDAAGNQPINSGTSNGISYSIDSDGLLEIEGLSSSNSPHSYYVMANGIGICGLEPFEVKVHVTEIPSLRVSNPSIVCDPTGTVDLTQFIEGFNPGVYDYNVISPNGAAMSMNELDQVAVSGDYIVSSSVKGSNCWNDNQRIRVVIAEELLVADFEYVVDLGGGLIFPNGEIQILEDVQFNDLSLGDVVIWNWDFGDGGQSSEQNPIHQYQRKGSYTVTLTTIDSIGCMSEYQIQVEVFDDYNVIIPNAFTPDNVKNQYFKPKYRGIASMHLYIFNTWGELIFESNSLETLGWDGTLNGTDVPNGNYVYRAKFTSRSGEEFERAGVFILIR